ncbi:hypothetical protein CONPUDRAFT_87147 [Coniophora puteana RWD-64-598 SS2]|uniref:RNA-dependent RNA polymerase n=1 Tax=Coniophora puteana (strain RWD-64-598) TaxID=741705 RepID=A0A5M3N8Y9_CONPW|nr:uncharacterized protein CONPUDRAFT_87147 [Coniophora puteana RWD-64-598 SS2]EIW87305.1 hypothetical protein CONPUDRAFT_87147 [Coniophora puteana RWD-64-598 SS2]
MPAVAPPSPSKRARAMTGGESRETKTPRLDQPRIPALDVNLVTRQPSDPGPTSARPFNTSHRIQSAATPVLTPTVAPTTIHPEVTQYTFSPAEHFKHGPVVLGENLGRAIIAHDSGAVRLIDYRSLAWPTTYEIARGVTQGRWSWQDVTPSRLDRLKGLGADTAPKVGAVMKDLDLKGRGTGSAAVGSEVWSEYDREEKAIVENRGRGLGLMGEWEGKHSWYGGKIQQVITLRVSGNPGQERYEFELEKPKISRSHRLSRFLGSRRLIQMRIPEQTMWNYGARITEYLSRHSFVLCGRVFIPVHAKENSVYLVETDQDHERSPRPDQKGDQYRYSLAQIVQWHNDIVANHKQPISKWSTRWALALSTSVPGMEFSPENVFYMDDVYSPEASGMKKAPAELTMTDGCGWINAAALTQLMRNMGLSSRPTAIQARLAGAKGMWLLHPDPAEQLIDGPAKIWIRSSQNKIASPPADRGHLVLDLLAPSRVTHPSRLSQQTIVNMAHNGVPETVFTALMAAGLDREVQQLTQWDGPNALVAVWRAVERAGGVSFTRVRRRIAGQARALGLGRMRPDDRDSEAPADIDTDDEDAHVLSSGVEGGAAGEPAQPPSVYEAAMQLLQSGFRPQNLDVLYDKIRKIVTMVIDDYVKSLHIPILESAEAYIVPDPYGVLKEGEIYFRSSDGFKDPETGARFDILKGDVLVLRNPTRLPSDVQKVRAVTYPELEKYYDVIIFPTCGARSLASYLGGGDTVLVVWDKQLVQPFNSTPLYEEPQGVRDAFERNVETVRDFDKRIRGLPRADAEAEFQKILLLGLSETKVGLYSKFHDIAVFTTCLDASKTGLRVKTTEFHRHRTMAGNRQPRYIRDLTDHRNSDDAPCKRDKGQKPFILDVLVDEGRRMRDAFLTKYDARKQTMGERHDRDLLKPVEDAEKMAAAMEREGIPFYSSNLQEMERHIDTFYKRWIVLIDASKSSSSSRSRSPADKSKTNDPWDALARDFAKVPPFQSLQCFPDAEVKCIIASRAYRRSRKFAFNAAFLTLCSIKARALGCVPFTTQFAESMSVSGAVARALDHTLAQEGE